MKSFEDILFHIQDRLSPYICYCNSETNLTLINYNVSKHLDSLKTTGQINNYTVKCDRKNNPLGPWSDTSQIIRVEFDILMTNGITNSGMVVINTRTVDVYTKMDFHKSPMTLVKTKVDPNDAYERAMKGI